MPFALIIIAVGLVVVGLRGTQGDLYCLLRSDFTGQNNFLYWLAAVLLIGMIGYIDKLRPVSDAFLVLLVIALFFASKGGFFTNFNSALNLTATTTTTAPTPAPTTTPTPQTGADLLAGALPPITKYIPT